MDLDQLKSSWKKNSKRIEENVHLKKEEMETILKNRADKTTHGLSRVFIMGIVIQSLTIGMQLINVIRYSEEKNLLFAIVISIGLISLALIYTLTRYNMLKSEVFDILSLSESLRRKIEFYKFSYSKWLLSFAFSFVIFLWSINMIIGDFTSLGNISYRLLGLYSGVFLFIYFSYRYAHSRYLNEYEISLNDLGGAQLSDLKQKNVKFRRFKIILIGTLLLMLIIGIALVILK